MAADQTGPLPGWRLTKLGLRGRRAVLLRGRRTIGTARLRRVARWLRRSVRRRVRLSGRCGHRGARRGACRPTGRRRPGRRSEPSRSIRPRPRPRAARTAGPARTGWPGCHRRRGWPAAREPMRRPKSAAPRHRRRDLAGPVAVRRRFGGRVGCLGHLCLLDAPTVTIARQWVARRRASPYPSVRSPGYPRSADNVPNVAMAPKISRPREPQNRADATAGRCPQQGGGHGTAVATARRQSTPGPRWGGWPSAYARAGGASAGRASERASSPCLCGLGRYGAGVSATRGPQPLP